MLRAIATIAAGPEGPALRVRSLIPSAALQRAGVGISASPLFTQNEYREFSSQGVLRRTSLLLSARRRLLARLHADQAEIAVVHRQADLSPSLAVERAAARGRRLIYDVDDPIWLSRSRNAQGHPLALLKGSSRKAGWLAAHADHVIAGNEILAEWLARRSRNVTIVPSLVDTGRFEARVHSDQEELVIGWIGSHTTAPYLQRLERPLLRLQQRFRDRKVRLVVVGGPRPLRLGPLVAEHLPWSEEAERQALARMDIGVMPLPNNEWTRGKCAYKALQYMAAGIPVVADEVGVASQVVAGGGMVVRDEEQWEDALAGLGEDVDLRRELGREGRRHVVEHYSVDRWATTLAGIVRGDL